MRYLCTVWSYIAVTGIIKAERPLDRKTLGGDSGGREDSGNKGGVAKSMKK